MSANYPPPQQQPGGQNPFAQQQYAAPQAPYGAPQQAPYGAPAPGGFNGYPPPAPAAPARSDVGMAILAALAATLVLAAAYGGILRAMSKNDGSFYEFRLIAIAVGAAAGFAIGKAGGRNAAVPFVAVVAGLAAVILGELFGGALIISHYVSSHGGQMSVTDILFHHFGQLWDAWKEDFNVKRFFFLAFAALASFGVARSVADR